MIITFSVINKKMFSSKYQKTISVYLQCFSQILQTFLLWKTKKKKWNFYIYIRRGESNLAVFPTCQRCKSQMLERKDGFSFFFANKKATISFLILYFCVYRHRRDAADVLMHRIICFFLLKLLHVGVRKNRLMQNSRFLQKE